MPERIILINVQTTRYADGKYGLLHLTFAIEQKPVLLRINISAGFCLCSAIGENTFATVSRIILAVSRE